MAEYLITLSLLIAVVLLIRGVFRKSISPRVRYALWLVVAIRLCLPFSLFEVEVPFASLLDEPEESVTSSEQQLPTLPSDEVTVVPSISKDAPTVTVTPHPMVPSEPDVSVTWSDIPSDPTDAAIEEAAPIAWSKIALIVWASGSGVLALWFIITGSMFHYRLYADRKLYKTIRRTKVYISASAGAPCLAGLIPSIYITPEASKSKSQTLIMIHEYMHMRHGDHIWAVVRILALIVHWWNPLVWAAALLSKQDAELACDDAVAAKLNDDKRFEYAHILLDTIPQKHRHVVGLGSAPMKERIFMLTKKQKNRMICVVLAIILAICAVGCSFVSLNDDSGNEEQTPPSENTDDPEYREIPEIILTEVDALPYLEDTALFRESPVGGTPTFYFFDDTLTFYIKDNLFTDGNIDAEYYTGTLTLPDGCSDAAVVHVSRGGGSGEVDITVKALQNGETVYLNYFFNAAGGPKHFVPKYVTLLSELQVKHLKEMIDSVPIRRSIYRCDDVYRSEDTPTHGEAQVYIPIALTDYRVQDCQILLCDDECDPTDVLSRAFWGYAPAWTVDRYEEYTTVDGWNYATRKYINEIPEQIRSEMQKQGAPDTVIYPREYLYLMTLDDTHYAYINIVPNDIESDKPADEEAAVNELVKQMTVFLSPPITLSISYPTDELLSSFDDLEVIDITSDDMGVLVAISSNVDVKDVRITELVSEDFKIRDCISLKMVDLRADKPLLLMVSMPGTRGSRGLTYTDTNGTVKRFEITRSGQDGDALLIPITDESLAEDFKGTDVMQGNLTKDDIQLGGEWFHSYSDANGGEAFYYLELTPATAKMRFYHGLYESEYANCYSGTYTANPQSYTNTATLHDFMESSDHDITIEFGLGYSIGTDGESLSLTVFSCDVEKYQHLIGKTLVFKRDPMMPVKIPTETGESTIAVPNMDYTEKLWSYPLTTTETISCCLDAEGNCYLVHETLSGKSHKIVQITDETIGWYFANKRYETTLPLLAKKTETGWLLYISYTPSSTAFYEITLLGSDGLTFDSAREITKEDAIAVGAFSNELVTVTSLSELASYRDRHIITAPLYDFYHDLLSRESDIPELNTVVISDFSIRFTVPVTEYTSYFSFTVEESGLDTLPIGSYEREVLDIVDVIMRDPKEDHSVASFADVAEVKKLRTFISGSFIWNTPSYGSGTAYPGMHNYICDYHGNGYLPYEEYKRIASEEFGVTDFDALGVESFLRDGRIESGAMGGEWIADFLEVNKAAEETTVVVQYYSDASKLLKSHKIAYRFGSDGKWHGYEMLEKGHYEPYGLRYAEDS